MATDVPGVDNLERSWYCGITLSYHINKNKNDRSNSSNNNNVGNSGNNSDHIQHLLKVIGP